MKLYQQIKNTFETFKENKSYDKKSGFSVIKHWQEAFHGKTQSTYNSKNILGFQESIFEMRDIRDIQNNYTNMKYVGVKLQCQFL